MGGWEVCKPQAMLTLSGWQCLVSSVSTAHLASWRRNRKGQDADKMTHEQVYLFAMLPQTVLFNNKNLLFSFWQF